MITRRKKINQKVQNSWDYPSKTCIHNQGSLPKWWKVSRTIRKKGYNVPREAQGDSNGFCVKWVR